MALKILSRLSSRRLPHKFVDNGEVQNRPTRGGSVSEQNTPNQQPKISPRARTLSWKMLSTTFATECSIVAFLAVCVPVLFLLRSLDHSHTGFSYDPTASSYYWKYGPTAVLVIIIAFWRQADYSFKIQAAYVQMIKDPLPADYNILLDYMSPILPSAFYLALRKRHWAVVLSICVFAFLKIATVASTALLIAQSSTLQARDVVLALAPGGQRQDMLPYDTVPDGIAASYIGARQRNLTWPTSTSPQIAFQELSTINDFVPQGSRVSAQVKAFYPSLVCEVADTSSNFSVRSVITSLDTTVDLYLDYQTSSTSGSLRLSGATCNPDRDTCDQLTLVPYTWLFYTDDRDPTGTFIVNLLSLSSELTPGTQSFPRNDSSAMNPLLLQGNGWTQSVDWITTVVCQTNYSIEDASLSATHAADSGWVDKEISSPLTHTGIVFPDYAYSNLTVDVFRIAELTTPYATIMYKGSAARNMGYGSMDWFQMMLFEINSPDLVALRDSATLIASLTKVFNGLASAWVGTWLDFPDHLSTTGVYDYQTSRLRTSDAPLYTMVAAFSISLVLVLILLCRHFSASLPEQSDDVLTDCKILKQNPTFHSMLESCGSASDKELEMLLGGRSYSANKSLQDRIQIMFNAPSPDELHERSRFKDYEERSYWCPVSSKTWFMGLTALLTVASIVGLEMVQLASDARSSGLLIRVSTSTAQNLVTVLPALVALTIAMLFSSLKFSVATTFLYLYSYRRTRPVGHFLHNSLRQLPPYAILTQMWQLHYSSSLMFTASLLGSILTIIVSGLYGLEESPARHATVVFAQDTFDFNAMVTDTNSTSNTFTFVERRNESFPDGTYQELAFPLTRLNMDDTVVANLIKNAVATSIEIDLPVIRASLNCSIIPQSYITLRADKMWQDPNENINRVEWADILSISPLPEGCERADPSYSKSDRIRIGSDPFGSVYENQTSSIAQMSSPYGIVANSSAGAQNVTDTHDSRYPPGCPSVAFTIGTYTLNQTDTSTTTQFICTQYFESIPSTLTFTLPDLKIDPSKSPILHEDQAYVVSRVAWDFAGIFKYGIPESWPVEENPVLLDSFFESVVHGINGVPIQEMLGQDPEHQQRFIDAAQHVYRVYMAQLVAQVMRKPLQSGSSLTARQDTIGSSDDVASQVNAYVLNTSRMRIVQNHTPKTVLQVLLGIMLACLLIGWRDIRAGGKLLPHNPCTIAGRMSYLAGSKLVKKIDENEDSKTVYERLKREKIRLRFGWWQDGVLSVQDRDRTGFKERIVTSTKEVIGSARGLRSRKNNRSTKANVVVEEDIVEPSEREDMSMNDGNRRFGLDVADSITISQRVDSDEEIELVNVP